MTRFAPALLVLALSACDGNSNGPPPEPATRPSTETISAAGAGEEAPAEVARESPTQAAGPCRAEPPNVLIAPAPEVPAVAIAPGLVVFPESASRLALQAIDAQARPIGELEHVDIDGARALFALRRVGDRFVVLTERGSGAARAIVAQMLDAEGAAIGDPIRVDLPDRLLTIKVQTTHSALFLARSHPHGAPALDRFELGSNGIAHRSIALAETHAPGDRRVEVLGLAIEGYRWVVAWRAGAAEATDSEVVLSSNRPVGPARRGTGEPPIYEAVVEALHHALAIESFAFDGDAVVAIAAHEMSRPALVTVTRESERATEVAAGAPVPFPFAGELSALARVTGDRLVLELRNAAGDRIGETLVAAGLRDSVADVARADGGFLVVYAGAEANGRVVNASYIACDGPRARADD